MLCILAIFCMTTLAIAADTPTWDQLAPLPDPLGVATPFAGVSGGALLVAGGANFPDKMPWEGGKKVWHDRVWKSGALTTQPLPPLPIALSGASGALVGDTLIVACGSEASGEQAATNRATTLRSTAGALPGNLPRRVRRSHASSGAARSSSRAARPAPACIRRKSGA